MFALLPLILLLALPQAEFFKAIDARDAIAVDSMLQREPALVTARDERGASAVTKALFALVKGEGFMDPPKNTVLQAILARSPKLDIYETAALGTVPQLESMLRADAEALARPNRFGWTLLHMSAFAGNAATTEMLIRRGASIHVRAKSRFRNTPLQTALLTGQYATAKLLLDAGADPLVRPSKGFTPMHEAALLGRRDIIELLLERGAELNSVADNGHTPLAEAVRGGHTELVEWMKTKGAVVGVQEKVE